MGLVCPEGYGGHLTVTVFPRPGGNKRVSPTRSWLSLLFVQKQTGLCVRAQLSAGPPAAARRTTAVPSPGSRKWRGLGRQLKLLAEQGGRFSVCVWGRCDSACLGLYPIVATSN